MNRHHLRIFAIDRPIVGLVRIQVHSPFALSGQSPVYNGASNLPWGASRIISEPKKTGYMNDQTVSAAIHIRQWSIDHES